jgi:dipeptidyl aminopeptidase/acylaminoacyl peptidase
VTPPPRAIVSFYGYGDIPVIHDVQVDKPISREIAYEGIGEHEISESPLYPRVMFYNYCRQNGLWVQEVTGCDPATHANELDRYCPIRHVSRDYPPTLLLHGDKDTDVPFEQSVRMAAELKKHKVPHQLIRMENRDHLFDVFDSFSSPERKVVGLRDPKVAEAYDTVLSFLAEHLATPAQPAPATGGNHPF